MVARVVGRDVFVVLQGVEEARRPALLSMAVFVWGARAT
jgi:hypothetical protein